MGDHQEPAAETRTVKVEGEEAKPQHEEQHHHSSVKSEKSEKRSSSRRGDGEDSRDRRRDKKRSRSRSPDRKRRSRSRSHDKRSRRDDRRRESDRDRERERERDRERERERERERGDRQRRSPDHRRSRRDYDDERRQRRRDGRDDEEMPSDPQEAEMYAIKKKEEERERAHRTVYIWQLPRNVTERELIEFFKTFEVDVVDVKLITDRITRKFKGIGYVELKDLDMVSAAIGVSGQKLRGKFPIMVKASEAEKNFAAEEQKALQMPISGPVRVYVGQIHEAMTEDDLKDLFSSFGEIESVRLQLNDQNMSKGFGFVHFKRTEDAKAAAENLDGFELGGRKLKVSVMPSQGAVMQTVVTNGRELDGIDGNGGLIHSAESRAILMAKLQRGEPGMPGVPPSGMFGAPIFPMMQPVPAPAAPSVPTTCLLLSNMFDQDSELKEEDFSYEDIEEDVKDECSNHGPVTHVHAVPQSTGLVFVRFKTSAAAQDARNNLNGRWFAGKQILAEFIDPIAYEGKFPRSALGNA